MNVLRRRIVTEHQKLAGAQDEPEIYAGPAGDPGLCGPGSVSWKVNGDPAALAIAGIGAIVLEILHPSVMAGVSDRSSYREDPFRRARTTGQYVLATTFGATEPATELIARVRRMHSRVNGTRPDGTAYRALDPDLIAWVHTCIPWAIMRAYERYNQPLTPEERDRYLAEQAVIGRMGGADAVPESMAELDAFVARIRPGLAVTTQTLEFFDFLLDNPFVPDLPGPLKRAYLDFNVRAGMSVMPAWARRLAGFDRPGWAQPLLFEPHLRVTAATLRWAYGEPDCVRMARERVAEGAVGRVPTDVRPRRRASPHAAV